MTSLLEGVGIGIVIDVIFNLIWHRLMVVPHFNEFVRHHHLHEHAIKEEHRRSDPSEYDETFHA